MHYPTIEKLDDSHEVNDSNFKGSFNIQQRQTHANMNTLENENSIIHGYSSADVIDQNNMSF